VAHDLLALSARIIDEQVVDEPFNRVNQQLSLVADDIAVVESFSNAITVRTAGGLVVLDASSAATGPAVVEALRPLYDEPEFVVHNIWRLYGGWWDGNPAHLHPPGERAVATEVAELAGGADTLAWRCRYPGPAGRTAGGSRRSTPGRPTRRVGGAGCPPQPWGPADPGGVLRATPAPSHLADGQRDLRCRPPPSRVRHA